MRDRSLRTALLILLLSVGGCSSTPAEVESAAASSTTAVAPTLPPATGSTTMAVADSAAGVLAAFDAWVEALYAGNYRHAWDLMAPSSQAALGDYALFESWGSEMTEGWGSWAEATEVEIAVDVDASGRSVAVISGVVAKEGMPEMDTTTVFFVNDGDGVVVSPFEEFGNVAAGLANPDSSVPIPPDSGSGRRIVYSNGQQRVWIVEGDETVVDSYLISGREGVPDPGVYEVFSKSEIAYAGHDGITMRYMVRFTYAESGLAIGFHSIPNTASGEPLQTEEQLGEFHSAGCVRQSLGHAAALYEWADEGTIVHVVE